MESVKLLRERTLAGYLECRQALADADGDLEAAEALVRERGQAEVLKRRKPPRRDASLIHSYVHAGGRICSVVELAAETDFVTRTEEFRTLLHDLALHVAAMGPKWLAAGDMPLEALADGSASERDCLLSQPFVKDHERTVEEMVDELSAKTGESCSVVRFLRWESGVPEEKPAQPCCAAAHPRTSSSLRWGAFIILGALLFLAGLVAGAV